MGETSRDKIAKMTAKIEKLTGEITELDGEIGQLATDITTLGTTMDTNQKTRDGEHDTFLTNQADMTNAISAVERAIEALKESKQALGGKAEREALVQVKDTVSKVMSQQELSRLGDVFGIAKPGEAYTYKYKSNDVIATLEGLRTTFKNRRLALEDDEHATNSAHELKQQALSNEQKFRRSWNPPQGACTAPCLPW